MTGVDMDALEINADPEEEKKNYDGVFSLVAIIAVEQSLQNGLHEGMMLEIPSRVTPNTYWIATIVMACGPLLRLRFVGQEADRTQDFWYDLTKVQVYPLGWCRDHHLRLQPPSELLPKLLDYEAFAIRALQNAVSVPPELLSGKMTGVDMDALEINADPEEEKKNYDGVFSLVAIIAVLIRKISQNLILEFFDSIIIHS
ncbi:Scm-like with four MBT domains protein 2 [Zootermopsis nevadensis]|uniref:Scm-like with four MBT domains protein 2 n=1 Tax=Zootermopsis nevadensis TaxID=136037 RepID=A0A067QFY2_ZOONE|nr:Scm-like with four MBT domains protein 2 [Zootermopsis nevadensis]